MATRTGSGKANGPGAGTAATNVALVIEADVTKPTRRRRSDNQPEAPAGLISNMNGVSTGLDEPNEEYLTSLRQEKQAEYGEQDQQIDDMRQTRAMQKRVVLPDGCRFVDVEVRDPTLAEEIQRVVAALTLNEPMLTIKQSREGETYEKNATLRKDATKAILAQAARRIPGKNTFREITDGSAGDGGGWSKFLFLRDTWEARYGLRRAQFKNGEGTVDEDAFLDAVDDAKKAAGVPFIWTYVDARTVYPVWSQGRLTEVLEVTRRPIHEALRRYRLGLDEQGKIVPASAGLPLNEIAASRIPNSVTFYEHWDDEFCSYMVEGGYGDKRVVKQFRHRYGRHPYFFAPGFTFPWMTNIKVGWGVAQTKKWLVDYLAFLQTLHAQQAARDTFAPMYRTVDPKGPGIMGRNGRPKATEKYKLGEIVNGPPGSTLSAFPFPTNSTALKEQIAYIEEKIQRIMTPRVTSEIGTSGLEGAGFAMNQVLSEARIYQDPIAQAIEMVLTDVTKFMWHLIRTRVRETVWVEQTGENGGWLGLGPDDLQVGVGIKWELDPERPSAKLLEERYWHERIDKGTASHKQAIEAMGDDPEKVRFERDMEAMRQEPWYIQYRQQQILKELGRGDILSKAAAAAASTGGLPGLPNPNVLNAGAAVGAAQAGPGAIPNLANLAMAPGGGGLNAGTPGPGPQPVPTQSIAPTPLTRSAAPGARLAA